MSPSRNIQRGRRRERIDASPRFIDGAFRNTKRIASGLKPGGAGPLVKDLVQGTKHRRPPRPLPAVEPRIAWQRSPETGLRTTWLGHSTVLVEIDGSRILTDPVWSDRASPVGFAGPKRFQPVPIAINDLPQLDAVVLSHDHYDHLDRDGLTQIARTGAPIITSLGVGARLERWGVPSRQITELDWWETAPVAGRELTVTATPAQHFSGRGVRDRNRTLWSSMAIVGPTRRVFFSGDTGLTDEFQDIGDRMGPFDLTMIEVGAFHRAWGDVHLGPNNALKAHRMLGGGALLPVHWGTFDLALHAWDDPAETLLNAADSTTSRLIMPQLGQATEPDRYERVTPWWRSAGGTK